MLSGAQFAVMGDELAKAKHAAGLESILFAQSLRAETDMTRRL
jgi:hypothetical protein